MSHRSGQRWHGYATTALLIAGLAACTDGAYIQAKAWLAQALLERSWSAVQRGEADAPPWPWADTQPVAALRVPRLGLSRLILAGASGRNLAFGPTHVAPSSLPGKPGHVVISAHRDTHFRFLKSLRAGDRLELEAADRTIRSYRVTATDVIDTRDHALGLVPEQNLLTLVTCYPFDSPGNGTPLRYLVHAETVDALFTGT